MWAVLDKGIMIWTNTQQRPPKDTMLVAWLQTDHGNQCWIICCCGRLRADCTNFT